MSYDFVMKLYDPNKMMFCCDSCNKEITYDHGVNDYRILLRAERLEMGESLCRIDIFMLPPIERDYHFCDLGCLENWLKKKKNNNENSS
jgi:hypothetical protein